MMAANGENDDDATRILKDFIIALRTNDSILNNLTNSKSEITQTKNTNQVDHDLMQSALFLNLHTSTSESLVTSESLNDLTFTVFAKAIDNLDHMSQIASDVESLLLSLHSPLDESIRIVLNEEQAFDALLRQCNDVGIVLKEVCECLLLCLGILFLVSCFSHTLTLFLPPTCMYILFIKHIHSHTCIHSCIHVHLHKYTHTHD